MSRGPRASTIINDSSGIQVITDAKKALEDMDVDKLQSESHPLEGKVTGTTPLIDHNSEDDLYDAVAAAILNPQFSQVLANVVNQDDDEPGVQNFLSPSWPNSPGIITWPKKPWMSSTLMSGINPQTPPEVQNFIGPLLTTVGGLLGQLIFSGLPANAAPGNYPQALPPNIEQGIFSTLGKFLTHPTVTNIVKDIVTDVFAQHGIHNSKVCARILYCFAYY